MFGLASRCLGAGALAVPSRSFGQQPATRIRRIGSLGVGSSRAGRPPGAVVAPARDSASTRATSGGAELPEEPARRVELYLRGVVVTERPAGEPDEHPDPRGLVGRLDPLPGRPCAAQRGERGPAVA